MYKKFHYLHEDAKEIRKEVFVREQGFKHEFDDVDETAVHLVFYSGTGCDKTPAGVCRYFPGETKHEYMIGRIAVLKPYRHMQLGSRILAAAEENIKAEGGTKSTLFAQVRAREFYERNGYTPVGDIFLEEYCEHIRMEKILL